MAEESERVDLVAVDAQSPRDASDTRDASTSEAERESLEEFLERSLQPAVRGRTCVAITEEGSRRQAFYRLEQDLKHLLVSRDKRATRVAIASIRDVYTLAADGAECFPSPVTQVLEPKEQPRLLMLTHGAVERRLCLVLGSAGERDELLRLLQVLCLYGHEL